MGWLSDLFDSGTWFKEPEPDPEIEHRQLVGEVLDRDLSDKEWEYLKLYWVTFMSDPLQWSSLADMVNEYLDDPEEVEYGHIIRRNIMPKRRKRKVVTE